MTIQEPEWPDLALKHSELLRLQGAFAREADAFHDTKLSVLYSTGDGPLHRQFRDPHHLIMLWQYYGALNESDGPRLIANLPRGDMPIMGVPGAKLSCYGVVEGNQVDKFVRMALRAGSIFSDREVQTIRLRVVTDFQTNHRGDGKPVLISNGNRMAVWLDQVLHHLDRTHPGYGLETRISLDPFAASLATVDALLASPTKATRAADRDDIRTRRFRVALTFSGDRRPYVAEVARALVDTLGKGAVFYDADFDAQLARPNLDQLLQSIYHDNSDLVAVFLSPEYEKRDWCGLEWRAVRDLIKQKQDERVMLLRFENCDVKGVFSIDGQLDLSSRTPAECAAAILERIS